MKDALDGLRVRLRESKFAGQGHSDSERNRSSARFLGRSIASAISGHWRKPKASDAGPIQVTLAATAFVDSMALERTNQNRFHNNASVMETGEALIPRGGDQR